jgi:hypothetical protein
MIPGQGSAPGRHRGGRFPARAVWAIPATIQESSSARHAASVLIIRTSALIPVSNS